MHHVSQAGEIGHGQAGLQQVARFVVGIARIDDDAAVLRHVAAQLGRQFHHLRGEGAHGGDEGVGARQRAQHHGAGGRAGGDQRAVGGGGVGIGHRVGLQAQPARVLHQGIGAGGTARGDQKPPHAQRGGKHLDMRHALHPGADDEHGPRQVRRQLARSQRRHGGGAPRGDGGAVQNQAALARGHVEHRHVALDGGARGAGVGGREGDELGHRRAGVAAGHGEKVGALGHGHDQARRHADAGVGQQGFNLVDQRGPGQALGGAGGVKQGVGHAGHSGAGAAQRRIAI